MPVVQVVAPIYPGDSYRARCAEHGLLAVGSKRYCEIARISHLRQAHKIERGPSLDDLDPPPDGAA